MTITELQAVTSFSVTPRYGRNETSLDVNMTGQPAPIARLFKASQYDSRRPLQVLVGPQLTDLAGYVNSFAAYAPDRTKIGVIGSRRRPLGTKRWHLDQPGLPTLTAKPTGASSLRYRFPLALVLAGTIANSFLPFHFRFQSKDSQGFTVSRRAGVRARFTVIMHDPRLDRRLVLATVVALSQYESNDLRQEAVDLTANPFKA
jgi:hypothetical protein